MKHGIDACRSLEQGLLRLYRQAVVERRWEVAEPLMCALEQLAKSDPDCEASVEQAYLCIAWKIRGGDAGARPADSASKIAAAVRAFKNTEAI